MIVQCIKLILVIVQSLGILLIDDMSKCCKSSYSPPPFTDEFLITFLTFLIFIPPQTEFRDIYLLKNISSNCTESSDHFDR